VIDSRDISGSVTVNAPNVTIRRSRIRGNAFMLIRSNSTALMVEDSELINQSAAGQVKCHNGIGFGGFTIRRTEITGCENAADVGEGNVRLEDNYIHDLDTQGPSHVWGNSPHTDGIQGNGSNVVIDHNWIDPSPGSGITSGIIATGSSTNYRIEDNYIDGRGTAYAIYAPRSGGGAGNAINRNELLRGHGYVACALLGVTIQEFNGNIDAITKLPLTAPQMDNDAGCRN
jgi:hypothetical protein